DPNALSLEHVPPKSLGGRPRTLTCKKCNNEAGKMLDSALKRRLVIDDVQARIPGARLDVRFSPGEDIWLPATFQYNEAGNIILQGFFNPKRSSPTARQRAQELLEAGFERPQIQHREPGRRRTNIALLRIAYLYAFSLLGYGLIFHPTYQRIREQLDKPTE